MMISLISMLMSLLMSLAPIAGEAALEPKSLDFVLRDVQVTLNGEAYDLGVDCRARCAASEGEVLLEAWLEAGEERLFPLRFQGDGEGLRLQLDGADRVFTMQTDPTELYAQAGEEMPEEAKAYMEASRDVVKARNAFMGVAMRTEWEDLKEEFAYLSELVDRGEPEACEVMLPGGEQVQAMRYG